MTKILAKLLPGKLQSFVMNKRFERFEERVHPLTWSMHGGVLTWAEELAKHSELVKGDLLNELDKDSIEYHGLSLRQGCMEQFKGKLAHAEGLRILIHVPSAVHSPGGYSLFSNLVQSFQYIGIQTKMLRWGDKNTRDVLESFRPNVLLTSDHASYLGLLDWEAIKKYKSANNLKIGLTASLEDYGNSDLKGRLAWARDHNVNFYYSFRAQEYLRSRVDYVPFYDEGYNVHSVEFGANIIQYYPLPGITRDIDYVFLASTNPDKWSRYFKYLPYILSSYPGVIDGPGWSRLTRWAEQPVHRYLYARAKIGINLHIQDSIDWPCELNERTYILAACGVPQVIDNPKLLKHRFKENSVFIGDTPEEYIRQFEYAINNPVEGKRRALIALNEVYAKHTTFHRAEVFGLSLLNELNN